MDAVIRRFLIAPSYVRMIRAQRGFERAIEGHFPRQPARNSYVHIRGDGAELVLIKSEGGADLEEERTSVPRSHAEALLDVCAGAVVYERTFLPLADGTQASIDKMLRPQGIDIVGVVFQSPAEAELFQPPVWFGPEVGGAFAPRAVALDGATAPGAVEPTNEGLDALLDLTEGRLLRRLGRGEGGAEAAASAIEAAIAASLERADSGGASEASMPAGEFPAQQDERVRESRLDSRGQQSRRAESEPAITSLRSIFSTQRPASPPRERQRLSSE